MAGRAANGEGTIYKRADGRYEAAVMIQAASGERKRLRVCARTRQEARRKLATRLEQLQHGVFSTDHRWTLGEYLDHWLEREKRRPLTRQRHESVVRLYLKPGLGNQRLEVLPVRVVQNFLDDLRTSGTSIATIHQVRKVLSAALTYAMRQELILRNVARLVELPSYRPAEASHWTTDELSAFLRSARTDPFYPVFVLLALYGLRRGEVLGIRWCDVDFPREVLRIRQQVQRINGALEQVELKTLSSTRDEPLLSSARDALVDQRAAQDNRRQGAGSRWRGSGDASELVFTTRSGNPIEPRNLARSFERICKQHNLRLITLHDMRHSNATAQKELEVHSRDIQAILGHGDVRTTGIYEHVDMKSKRNALQKVEGRLFSDESAQARCRQDCRQTFAEANRRSSNAYKEKHPPLMKWMFFLVAPTRIELVTS